MPDPETVYLIDDDPSIRRSLTRLLRTSGYHVQTYADPRQFLEELPDSPLGCSILGLEMRHLDGLQTQQALMGQCPSLSVVMLTAHGTVARSVRAMKNGAVDVLEKPIDHEVFCSVIETALIEARKRRQEQREAQEVTRLLARLTARENDVFALIAKGFTNGEAGTLLGISRDTVKLHRARVMKKLEADSLADLVRLYHAAPVH